VTPASAQRRLVVSDLRVGVSGREVLSGIDLALGSGEIHAVMGPNGSGKSTLAHVLMGKPGYRVLGGTVTLDGEDLLSLPAWERARRGLFLASQYPTEIPGVRLRDLLGEAWAGTARSSGKAASSPASVAGAELGERAAEEAARLGLDTRFLERALNVDLSGGERKRSETLQLALLRPAIAILDELDSGLDVDGLREVAQRLRAAVEEWDLGLLAITHYRRLLSVLEPGTVHVLVGGRIVARGGPELAAELERTGYAPYGAPERAGA
jgi:Fe-S cluster assembly ATP-binding protein